MPLLQGAWQSCHNGIRFNQKIAVETVEKEIGFLQYFPVVVVFINNENVSGRTEACGSYAKLWRSEKKLRCQSSLRPGPCKTSKHYANLFLSFHCIFFVEKKGRFFLQKGTILKKIQKGML